MWISEKKINTFYKHAGYGPFNLVKQHANNKFFFFFRNEKKKNALNLRFKSFLLSAHQTIMLLTLYVAPLFLKQPPRLIC